MAGWAGRRFLQCAIHITQSCILACSGHITREYQFVHYSILDLPAFSVALLNLVVCLSVFGSLVISWIAHD